MLSRDVLRHLQSEISRSDPWLLETNSFEQLRYLTMLDMLAGTFIYESALEVGCAAGAFTHHLALRSKKLRVVDVLPEAIEKCRRRLANQTGLVFCIADISETKGWGETYDLIVISEVLYYLESQERIAATVATLRDWLMPAGHLIFGSAINSVSTRWGLPCGAEVAASEFSKSLHKLESKAVVGSSPDENALIIKYERDA